MSVPQASNILVEEYSPRSQFWHIYCRQARFHAASLGQQTVLPILTYLPILKYLLLPPHAWSARIHAWTAHYSKRGSETHCLGRGENPPIPRFPISVFYTFTLYTTHSHHTHSISNLCYNSFIFINKASNSGHTNTCIKLLPSPMFCTHAPPWSQFLTSCDSRAVQGLESGLRVESISKILIRVQKRCVCWSRVRLRCREEMSIPEVVAVCGCHGGAWKLRFL